MTDEAIGEQRNDAPDALSVSGALALAKGKLESFTITLIGEVSEVSVKPGYKAAYFSVKDDRASMPCMMWNNRYKGVGFDLEVGQLVIMTGRFTVYAAKGRMSFDVFSLSLSGEGNLRLQVANIAKRLAAEGLIDEKRHRALPLYPKRIGLVTSPRSAAVHDVLRTLRRRYPLGEVLLAGVPVEGASAPAGIIEGIQTVARAGAEVILVVRGGGSFEDLMPFNDEGLARAIAACPVPVVTGIGHEVDTSIADMVADLRASTPTAAAEAVSPSQEAMESLFQAQGQGLVGALSRRLQKTDAYLQRIADKALFQDPMMLFATEAQWLDATSDRLQRALPLRLERMGMECRSLEGRMTRVGTTMLDRFKGEMSKDAARLNDLSPLNILGRGYAIGRDKEGHVVSSIEDASVGSQVDLTVSDGVLNCRVESIEEASVLSEAR